MKFMFSLLVIAVVCSLSFIYFIQNFNYFSEYLHTIAADSEIKDKDKALCFEFKADAVEDVKIVKICDKYFN